MYVIIEVKKKKKLKIYTSTILNNCFMSNIIVKILCIKCINKKNGLEINSRIHI